MHQLYFKNISKHLTIIKQIQREKRRIQNWSNERFQAIQVFTYQFTNPNQSTEVLTRVDFINYNLFYSRSDVCNIYNEKILTAMGLEKLAFFNDTRLFYLQYQIHEMSFSFRSIQINID